MKEEQLGLKTCSNKELLAELERRRAIGELTMGAAYFPKATDPDSKQVKRQPFNIEPSYIRNGP